MGIRWSHRPGRVAIATASVLVIAFVAATARLYVWPARGAPAHADAIVMFDGSGARLPVALGLARAHVAPNLVVSRSSQYWVQDNRCAPAIPGVKVICFVPSPLTTQGESELAGRLADQYHWRSVILVTTRPQDTRARLRMRRCFSGHLYVVTAPLPISQWPLAVAYEWAATLKAVFVQRSC